MTPPSSRARSLPSSLSSPVLVHARAGTRPTTTRRPGDARVRPTASDRPRPTDRDARPTDRDPRGVGGAGWDTPDSDGIFYVPRSRLRVEREPTPSLVVRSFVRSVGRSVGRSIGRAGGRRDRGERCRERCRDAGRAARGARARDEER